MDRSGLWALAKLIGLVALVVSWIAYARRPVRVAKSGRWSVAKLMGFVALLSVPIAYLGVPVARQAEWMRLARGMEASIRDLRPGDPSIVTPAVWDQAQGAVITAYCNICFSPEHVSTPEMIRLRDDLERTLKGPVNLDTLIWIWGRLGETGPHGERYIDRHRSMIEPCLPARP